MSKTEIKIVFFQKSGRNVIREGLYRKPLLLPRKLHAHIRVITEI